jgi:class 3 adenylate cyclase
MSAATDRLWTLIEERTRAGAGAAAIDRAIWDEFGGEWAVLFTDLVGFSRQVARFGIIHFLQIIHEQQQLLRPLLERHGGLLVKSEGDSLFVLFRQARDAVGCAVAMQRACQAWSATREPEDKVILCVGIGYGRLLKIGDEDIYGQEVNIASKLGEDTAKGEEILVSSAARDACGDLPGLDWEEMLTDFPGAEHCWRLHY